MKFEKKQPVISNFMNHNKDNKQKYKQGHLNDVDKYSIHSI